jgi:hypothetical protein
MLLNVMGLGGKVAKKGKAPCHHCVQGGRCCGESTTWRLIDCTCLHSTQLVSRLLCLMRLVHTLCSALTVLMLCVPRGHTGWL